MNKCLVVVGSGYIGTVVAACLAHLGREVAGLEATRASGGEALVPERTSRRSTRRSER